MNLVRRGFDGGRKKVIRISLLGDLIAVIEQFEEIGKFYYPQFD
jgi:hypothetical protein